MVSFLKIYLFKFLIFSFLLLGLNWTECYSNSIDKSKFYLNQIQKNLYHNTDSTLFYIELYSELNQEFKEDSLYAEYLNYLGLFHSITGENYNALNYFKQSNFIFKKLALEACELKTKLNIGELLYNWAQYDNALIRFNEVLKISQQKHYYTIEIKALNYIGKYYHSKGNFKESYTFYQKCYQLAQSIGDTIAIISVQNKIGKHFETIGKFAEALEYYLMSERMVFDTGNCIEMGTTYNSLGNMYDELNEYDKALLFHRKALNSRRKIHYREGVAKSLNNIGEVLVEINQLENAFDHFTQSLTICKEVGYVKGEVKGVQNQGVVKFKMNENKESIQKFFEALKLSKQIGYEKGVLHAYHMLALVYNRINQFTKALEMAHKGLELAIDENVLTSVSEFNLIISDALTKKGDYKRALEYYKDYTKVNDDIVNLKSVNKIAELKTQYNQSLKIRENEVLKKDNEIQTLMINRKNQFIIFVVIVLFLLSALSIIVYNRFLNKKKANIELLELNNSIQIKNSELDAVNKKLRKSKDQQLKLFSIISHELRNPIYWFRNLIQMLTIRIDTLDKDMIFKSLNSLNESATNTFHLMDNLLNWSKSQLGNIQYVPETMNISCIIKENVKLIAQYAECKNITVNYIGGEDIEVRVDKAMIKTVLRNLLSNAIKFTPYNGQIEIKVTKNCAKVQIQISDNGVGMEAEAIDRILNSSGIEFMPSTDKETGNGLGLTLSKEFIERNGGTLEIESELGCGSVFKFDVNLI